MGLIIRGDGREAGQATARIARPGSVMGPELNSTFESLDLNQPSLAFCSGRFVMPSFRSTRFTLKGHPFADGHGCANQVTDLQGASNLDGIDRVQSDAGNAAALATIGRTAENARLDTGFEISRVVDGHPRKQALPGITGRRAKGADDPFIYEKLRILAAEGRKLPQ